jgi:chitinase
MVTDDEQVKPKMAHDPLWSSLEEPPPRQLSVLRIVAFLAVLAAAAAGAVLVIKRSGATAAASTPAAAWFAPYVDVTLTPTYAFQSPAANPVGKVALGFVVARSSAPCTPSWGGYYTLDAAAGALNLDARIAQVKAQGGAPMISFGGQANTELAVGCTDAKQLAAAYLQPVQRYHVDSIDLDIEGSNLTPASDARRAAAIAADQKTLAASGRQLGVWLTLPVATSGLTPAGVTAVKDMLAAGVKLQGVNLLAMDFGAGVGSTRGMIGPVKDALNGAHGQLQSAFAAAGLGNSAAVAWHRIGVTVMIGQNDIASERFTLEDARELTAFVAQNGVARLSMWSLNRDSECGAVFAQDGVLSNTCSGVTQTPLEFTHIFRALPGTSNARTETAQTAAVPQVAQAPPDNPATSPYPIWDAASGYVAGYKVVWHRSIYQAKWFSQGAAPDAPAQGSAPNPWLLIGPISPGARAPKPDLLDTGHHPTWSASTVYRQGDRVMYKGLPYLARYYAHAQPPSPALPAQSGAAWQPLFTVRGEPAGAVR